MKFKPKNRDELYSVIKEVITNQEENSNYPYGLKDVDTSLITDINNLFSCFENPISDYELNRKINWNDPRNDITQWDVSNVTNMEELFGMSPFNQNISNWNISKVINMYAMFDKSQFNRNIGKWILQLNINCNLYHFNIKNEHSKKFGKIDSYKDFLKIHVTKEIIEDIFKSSNDKEKYQLLKFLKNHPDLVKDLNMDREIV